MNTFQNNSDNNKNSLSVDFLMPGTVIGSPLFDKKGNQLLNAKTPLTAEIIQKLKENRIERVFYLKNYEETKNDPQANKNPKKIFSKLLDPKIITLSQRIAAEIASNIKNNEFIQTTTLQALIDILLKVMTPNTPIPDELLHPRTDREPFPVHALHVTLLSMLIAIRHGFERPLIKQIGIGAYLHDIGKLKLPPEISYPNTALTEEQNNELKRHSALGFELIKLNGQLTGIVRKIVLLHHETVDGTGYPLGLPEKDIGYYPLIIALADSFDTLMSDTNAMPALPLKESLQQIIAQAGKNFPPFLVQRFIKLVSYSQAQNNPFTVGCFVSLINGEVAQITKVTEEKIEMRVIFNDKGKSVDPPTPIAIKKNATRKIKEKLNDEIQGQLSRRYPLPK